jgi:hypothetical protein
MFRCSYTIIREGINSCLRKLQLLKQSIKTHRCVVNTVVVWLHVLGPYWCMRVALFGSILLPNSAEKLKDLMKETCEFNRLYCANLGIFFLIRCQKIRADIQKMYTAVTKDAKKLLQ